MILSLRSNNFHGHILEELCALTSLQLLDLSHNKISGRIPRCVKNFSVMSTNNNSHHHMKVEPSKYFYGAALPLESALLVIKGRILEYSTILQLVKSVDFSHNNLSRAIPEEVTNFWGLQSLNLSYNLLIGSILENIGKMESMDFSMNNSIESIELFTLYYNINSNIFLVSSALQKKKIILLILILNNFIKKKKPTSKLIS